MIVMLENMGIWKGYTSFSADKGPAEFFHKQINRSSGEVVIFNLPKGTVGAYIGNNSAHKYEAEFLLGRNAKITSKRVNGILGVTVIENGT